MSQLDHARIPRGQLALFQRSTVRDILSAHNLSALQAERLHHDQWLSFEPRHDRLLHPAQEAELDFLCAVLVVIGHEGLPGLLRSLDAPYAYQVDRLDFDFRRRQWRIREEVAETWGHGQMAPAG